MLSKTLDVDIQTIHRWHKKEGLKAIDTMIKPRLYHGSVVIAFLQEKNIQKKLFTCRINELPCFKCKMPKTPLSNNVSLYRKTIKTALLVGICSHCKTAMKKMIAVKNLSDIEKTLSIKQIAQEGLENYLSHPLMTHFSIHGKPKRKNHLKTTDNNGQMNFFTFPQDIHK